MKTIRISREDMGKRIARFRQLKPLPIQNASIPEKVRDVVYSRKLLSVIGLETSTPIKAEAPIRGAAGMTITLAGEFEVYWNDDGAESATLRRFDTISFPPGVCRGLRRCVPVLRRNSRKPALPSTPPGAEASQTGHIPPGSGGGHPEPRIADTPDR